MPLNSSRGQCGSRIKRRSWKGEISRRETERGGEQLAGADTAVSDLSPTPAGKQTGSLCDLWSASPAGRPLLRLKEAGERERERRHLRRVLASHRYGGLFLSRALLSVWHLRTVL